MCHLIIKTLDSILWIKIMPLMLPDAIRLPGIAEQLITSWSCLRRSRVRLRFWRRLFKSDIQNWTKIPFVKSGGRTDYVSNLIWFKPCAHHDTKSNSADHGNVALIEQMWRFNSKQLSPASLHWLKSESQKYPKLISFLNRVLGNENLLEVPDRFQSCKL